MSERVESWWRGFESCILNTKKVRSCNKFKKWSVSLTNEFFRPKPWCFERYCPVCTRSASSFCRDPLYFFAHAMWVKWWYHAKFQPFQSSICTAFQFHGHLALSKQISKWMKNTNWIQKGLIIDDVDLNGAFWTHKNSGVQKNAMPLYHMSFRPKPWYFEIDCPFHY